MATPVEITYRVVGADQVAGALQQMENRARQMSSAMTGTMAPARQGVAALSSSLSHAASIMQQTGGATAELAQRLQTAILAISSATVAIQALRGITLAWAGAMAIANTALLALTASLAPFLAAAVIVGLVLAAGAGMVSGMKQVVELAPRMDAGLASTRTRMDEFKLSADDAAAGMRMGQLAAKDLREELARKAKQLATTAEAAADRRFRDYLEMITQWAAHQAALTGTIESTSAQLVLQLVTVQQTIQRLTVLRDTVASTREQQQLATKAIAAQQVQLIGLADALQRTTRAYALQQALLEQRRGERDVSEGMRLVGEIIRDRSQALSVLALAENVARIALEARLQIEEREAIIIQQIDDMRAGRQRDAERFLDGINKEILALQRRLPFIELTQNRLQAEREALEGVIAKIREEIAVLSSVDAKTLDQIKRLADLNALLLEHEFRLKSVTNALEGPTQAFARLQTQLSESLIQIQNRFVQTFGALGPLIFQAIQGIGAAVGNFFGDLVRGAKSFGQSLADFFSGIANSILNVFQQLVANAAVSWILSLILPGLGGFRSIFKMLTGFAQGGIVAGGLTPIFAAQGGGIVSRPTLALMGEGGQDEMVLNRRQAREFIGLPEGQAARPREAVIHLTIHNVIGDPRALGIMTAGDVAGVIVNDVSRRGPTIQAIRVALS